MEALEEEQHHKLNLKAKDSEDLATKAKTIIQEDLAASKMQVEGSSTRTKQTDLELKVRAKALEEHHKALLPRAKDFLSKIRIRKEAEIKVVS
jgi:hypothetical protein